MTPTRSLAAEPECALAARLLRTAQTFEGQQLPHFASASYESAINTKCPAQLSLAVEGLVRTTTFLKRQELERARQNLEAGRRLLNQLNFLDARAFFDKADTPELHREVVHAIEDTSARSTALLTTVMLGGRDGIKRPTSLALSLLVPAILFFLIVLLVRTISLSSRRVYVRPLRESGEGMLGTTFADILAAASRQPQRHSSASRLLPPGPLGQRLVGIEPRAPAVLLKLGPFEVGDFLNRILPLFWPSRFLVEGILIPGGSTKIADVQLVRRRLVRPSRVIAHWTFLLPVADTDARLSELRVSAYMVLFRIITVRHGRP